MLGYRGEELVGQSTRWFIASEEEFIPRGHETFIPI